MKSIKILATIIFVMVFGLPFQQTVIAQTSSTLSDQRMADSPEALIKSLGEVSFLTPEEMAAKKQLELSGLLQPFGIQQTAQILDPPVPLLK